MKAVVVSAHEGRDLDWGRVNSDLVFTHPTKGKIVHILILRDVDGNPMWDQPVWFEPVGARTIPVNSKGEIGMVWVDRPLVRDLNSYDFYGMDYTKLEIGRPSLELPRGFPKKGEASAETALREGAEELGSPLKNMFYLGTGSPNTTFFPIPQPIFVAEVDESFEGEIPPDVNEKIFKVEWFTREQIDDLVMTGQILCDMTMSSLGRYDAYLRSKEREARREVFPAG